MDDDDQSWRIRIQELYANIEELYSHVDITIVVFDRNLTASRPRSETSANALMQPLTEIARRVLETGETQHDIALDQTGRQRAHGFPLHDRGTIIGVACVVNNNSARRELFVRCAMAIFDGYRRNEDALLERERRALEEARRAHRHRDQFLAVVAHELRSPMAAILLWEQVLRDPTIDSEMRTNALDAIHESASGQALLVADLLDVSRAINGKLYIDRRRTSPLRVLRIAIETARPQASARQLAIDSDLDPELGDVLGDSRRLRQIFENLLSNAVKCTENGRISVQARQSDAWITIEITDTGCGIAPAFLPHLFEPFRQASEGDSGDGLGLGLGIARQLAELHGGTLSASSEGLGRGARFTVTLPRVHAGDGDEKLAPPTVTGVRVLVVDDDLRILDAMHRLLHDAGAVVASASSVAAACSVLDQGDTDVVLSDLGMPGEDGYSLVRRIRAMPGAMANMPVIAMTAAVSEHHRELALSAGFDRYLTKPIDLNLLVASIAALVRN